MYKKIFLVVNEKSSLLLLLQKLTIEIARLQQRKNYLYEAGTPIGSCKSTKVANNYILSAVNTFLANLRSS